MPSIKVLLLAFLCIALSGCGGSTSFEPVITGVKPQTLQYSKVATIYLGGKDLRSSLTVESGGACANPSFASNSTTDVLVLNCTVTVTGDLPLSVKSASGAVIYSTTLSVPKPQVGIVTSMGNIILELDPAAAPLTVNNFLSYANSGYFQNTLFHRVIPGFVIQGGGYAAGMVKKEGQGAPITLESNNGLLNLRGSVAMARTNEPNSATSEFFINLVNNTALDFKNAANPGYAVFGSVIQGLDVVDAIAAQATGVLNGFSDVPLTDVTITSAQQIK
jgi:peptidyl-prolyl cis-trans isomerase A (cyclophilin A)